MKNVSLTSLAILTGTIAFLPLKVLAEPQWIWSSKHAQDGEKATFVKQFSVAGAVKSATLALTCDNGATAILNGKTAAENPDWMEPVKADVTKLLKVGVNEFRIDARNADGTAAVVAILTIETADGKKQVVETGDDWQITPAGSSLAKPAVVIAKYGAAPWGDVFAGAKKGGRRGAASQVVTDAESIEVAPGFKVELLYTVPKADQGSWVSMTVDPKGRLIMGDQNGGFYRVTVPPIGTSEGTKVEPLPMPKSVDGKTIAGAHGSLYAFGSLYLQLQDNANFKPGEAPEHGLWRVRDTDGDDQFDKAELLRHSEGSGEHGPHSIVVSPDGKSLFFNNGNHTKPADHFEESRAPRAWQEDEIIPRMWDGNGHAKGIVAPGGVIYKADPEGKTVELFDDGYRNEFDIAFDANGELFTFDADMEWDIGSPWYRPTRIVHAVSGADYGWRSGAGKWQTYFEDSLPGTLDIGPGSPTGVVFGTGAKFPAKYQRAFFAADWTYGTMYAVLLTPDGATFKAEKTEFVSGKPLPLTDMIIHPKDGAMYFAVGGRKTQSALYRVTYTGSESTTPAAPYAIPAAMKLRRDLETLHLPGTGPDAIDKAWPSLAHADRFVRTAARIAIERQPAAKWNARALAETNPQASIEALIALARIGRSPAAAAAALAQNGAPGNTNAGIWPTLPEDRELQAKILAVLAKHDFTKLDADGRLQLLRAYELAFTRLGKPAPEVCAKVAARLEPLFPNADWRADRELVGLLVFLDSQTVVAKTVPLLDTTVDTDTTIADDAVLARNENYAKAVDAMHSSRPNKQAIYYAYALRNATAGWTPALRKSFFAWFPRTQAWRGGNSFPKFLENIRTEALANCVTDAGERNALADLSKAAPPAASANFVAPKGPGKNYSVDDVAALAKDGLKKRNFEQGKAMFTSTLCSTCHHFNGTGGNIGPDLTGAGNRYTLRDLTENIVEPSKVISDQYGSEQITLKNGDLVIGRVVVEENGKLFVMASPLAPNDLTPVDAASVKFRAPYPVSMMPPGLINTLNPDELLDLIAYIQSGGNPNDKAFK